MLKRLPKSTDAGEIKEELLAQWYPVRSVKQLTKKENNIEIKLPLFTLELDNTAKAKELYDLKILLYTVVALESYRPRSGLKQCFRCQRFNHTFSGCKLSPQCVICAGSHNHKDCPKREEARNDSSILKCANCGESGHPASYRGCKSYKAALENFEKPRRNDPEQGKKKPVQRTFNSKKVTEGLSFSSAVANRTLATPAQNRLEEARGQEQSTIITHPPSNVEQMIENICPLLASLGSPMDKFMLLSKLVEICVGTSHV